MIYTKNGDSGISSVITIDNIPKDDIIFELLGNLDELSSFLGISKNKQCNSISAKLDALQKELVSLSTWIAGGSFFDTKPHIAVFEVVIDSIENSVSMPTEIIVSGSSEESAYIDYCRTIARRSERSAVTFCRKYEFDKSLVTYLNRLSDYLFALAVYSEKI